MTQPDVIANPCGCNQPHAVHERGDQAFCRAIHAAGTIWRYELPITGAPVLRMPRHARVLSVGPFRQPAGSGAFYVDPPLDLWALGDPTADLEDRAFRIVGTGNPLPPDCGRFVGTTHSHGGELIWHVFEAAPAEEDQ